MKRELTVIIGLTIIGIIGFYIFFHYFKVKSGIEVETIIWVNGRKITSNKVLAKLTILTISGKKLKEVRIQVTAKWVVKLFDKPYSTDVQYIAFIYPSVTAYYNEEYKTMLPLWGIIEQTQSISYFLSIINTLIDVILARQDKYLVYFSSSTTEKTGEFFIDLLKELERMSSASLYDVVQGLILIERGMRVAMENPNKIIRDSEGYGYAPKGLLTDAIEKLKTAFTLDFIHIEHGRILFKLDDTITGYDYWVRLAYSRWDTDISINWDKMIDSGKPLVIKYWLFVAFRYRDVTGEYTEWMYVAVPLATLEFGVKEGYWIDVDFDVDYNIISVPVEE